MMQCALAPRPIQAMSRNVDNKHGALKRLWAVVLYIWIPALLFSCFHLLFTTLLTYFPNIFAYSCYPLLLRSWTVFLILIYLHISLLSFKFSLYLGSYTTGTMKFLSHLLWVVFLCVFYWLTAWLLFVKYPWLFSPVLLYSSDSLLLYFCVVLVSSCESYWTEP